MYLKQLILKGFKSFANRSVLTLEPGITAVVGPNGSGKSNISDAVLWVLGERNAKSLRGQVMQDVIFAGSSARKSVNVAEVTLVLDNSDATLPIDFSEVSITRRMYRSGESDYLINNTTVRRMDVLDILHDSGLGTGTHSIISQGHLDSILASKPEDRRALIEEAAGVLKHKQRKAKSVRKLEQMDNHLARANDVVQEVKRQLGPLQRRARKAEQFAQASKDLHSARLNLAVFELQDLQKSYNEILEEEEKENSKLNRVRAQVLDVQTQYDKLQEIIQSESSDVSLLVEKQSSVTSVLDRLQSRNTYLSDTQKHSQAHCESINKTLEDNKNKTRLTKKQLDVAKESLEDIAEKLVDAKANVKSKQDEFDAANKKREDAENELRNASQKQIEIQRNIDEVRSELASAQDKLAKAQLRVQTAKELMQDFSSRVQVAQQNLDRATKAYDECEHSLNAAKEATEKKEDSARLAQASENEAKDSLNDALQTQISLQSRLQALKQAKDLSLSNASPARAYVLKHADKNECALKALSDVIDVEPGYEDVVDAYLGDRALSLIVEETSDVLPVEKLMQGAMDLGNLSLYVRGLNSRNQGADNYQGANSNQNAGNNQIAGNSHKAGKYAGISQMLKDVCEPLLFRVHSSEKYANMLHVLFDGVYICDTLKNAFEACKRASSQNSSLNLVFITLSGCMVCSNGQVCLRSGLSSDKSGNNTLNAVSKDKQNNKLSAASKNISDGASFQNSHAGVIAQDVSIKKCALELENIEKTISDLEIAYSEARAKCEHSQKELLDAKQIEAQLQGAITSAKNDKETTLDRLNSAISAKQESEQSINKAQDVVNSTKPYVDSLNNKLSQLTSDFDDVRERTRASQSALEPMRRTQAEAQSGLSDAKLLMATLEQQHAYKLHMLEQYNSELLSLTQANNEAIGELSSMQSIRRRALLLTDSIQTIINCAKNTREQLDQKIDSAKQAFSSVHTKASSVREDAKKAQDSLNAQSEVIATLRERKARLEVQVQASVNTIVQDLGTTMEEALDICCDKDKKTLEDDVARLSLRVKNMGSVNPDAKREYEELKERFDHLNVQLEDLTSARSALKKIDSVIELRMKDDFKKTFDRVNEYFQEIFTNLFPGGSAALSLTDPQDAENSGVEVSAQPLGKRITKMSLMSGGEKSLVALALLFAVYKTRATPFYILDEVEAALDDSNLDRLMNYLQTLRKDTQLIMITHQRRTMETANVLFGVSMQADGITQVVSQRLGSQ